MVTDTTRLTRRPSDDAEYIGGRLMRATLFGRSMLRQALQRLCVARGERGYYQIVEERKEKREKRALTKLCKASGGHWRRMSSCSKACIRQTCIRNACRIRCRATGKTSQRY
eukprot:1189743-Prorocentrum_minimum.AAC.1